MWTGIARRCVGWSGMLRTGIAGALLFMTVEGVDAQRQLACSIVQPHAALPKELSETSGLAAGRLNPNAFWTHNDGSSPVLYAIDRSGGLLGTVRIRGVRMHDWEDLEAGPCGTGTCLYAADTGDNSGSRSTVTIFEFPEPRLGAAAEIAARTLPAAYPDGPRDAEALFRAPNGDLYVVTKGRSGPIGLYRYPAPYRYDQTVRLEHVREIGPEPSSDRDRISSATMTPDGQWVAILSYRTLYLYPADGLLGGSDVQPFTYDLEPLGQAQGEAIVVGSDGTVWITTESEKNGTPSWAQLHCSLPRN